MRFSCYFKTADIDVEQLTGRIESVEGIKNLHHLHLWRFTDNKINLEAHIDLIKDQSISVFESQLEQIQEIAHNMGIEHVTIQPEFGNQDEKDLIHNHH